MQYTSENLLIKSRDSGQPGAFAQVRAAQAGWDFLNMDALRMRKDERHSGYTGENEEVGVILGGRCHFRTSAGDFLNVGERATVFDGMPYAVYLPRHTRIEIEALTDTVE